MSDEKKVSLDFLGEQMLHMHSDLREVRSGYAGISHEQAGMRADFKRLEAKVDGVDAKVDAHDASNQARFDMLETKVDRLDAKVDAHDASNQLRFEQTQQTAATNLEIMLNAWKSSQR